MLKKSFMLVLFAAISPALLVSKTATAQTLKYQNTLSGSKLVAPGADPKEVRSLKEKLINDGAILMTKDEVIQHLSGNTQQWSNGGAHYQPDGRLDFIWEGDLFNNYSWQVNGKGRVCIENPDGFRTSCSLYFNYKDSVWTVITEELGERRDFFGGPDTILVGKKLTDLEPWDPSLSGKR